MARVRGGGKVIYTDKKGRNWAKELWDHINKNYVQPNKPMSNKAYENYYNKFEMLKDKGFPNAGEDGLTNLIDYYRKNKIDITKKDNTSGVIKVTNNPKRARKTADPYAGSRKSLIGRGKGAIMNQILKKTRKNLIAPESREKLAVKTLPVPVKMKVKKKKSKKEKLIDKIQKLTKAARKEDMKLIEKEEQMLTKRKRLEKGKEKAKRLKRRRNFLKNKNKTKKIMLLKKRMQNCQNHTPMTN